MQRRTILSAAMALAFSATALAQDGDLSRVTMRVLDSLDDAEAVVLALDANRAESEQGGESNDRSAARDNADDSDAARPSGDEEARSDLRRERDELREDDDDRGEGRREDRDVERPATPPAPTP